MSTANFVVDSGQAPIWYNELLDQERPLMVVDSGQAPIWYNSSCTCSAMPTVVDSGQAPIWYNSLNDFRFFHRLWTPDKLLSGIIHEGTS